MIVYFNIDNTYTQTSASNGTSANPFDFDYLLSGTSGFGMTSAVTTDIDINFKISGYRKVTTASTYSLNLKNESMVGVRFTLEPWNDSNDGWGIYLRQTGGSESYFNIGSTSASNWTILKKGIIAHYGTYLITAYKIILNNVYAYSCFFRLYGVTGDHTAFGINKCLGFLALSRFFGCTFSTENSNPNNPVLDINNNSVSNYVDFLGCIFIDYSNNTTYHYIGSNSSNNPAKIRVKYCISNRYVNESHAYDEGTYSRNTMVQRSQFSDHDYPLFVEPISANDYNTVNTFFQAGTWPPGGSIGTDNDNWKSRQAYYYNSVVNQSKIPLLSASPVGWTIEDVPASWGI